MSSNPAQDGANLPSKNRSNGAESSDVQLAKLTEKAMELSPGSAAHERDRKGSHSHRGDHRERTRSYSRSPSPSRMYKFERRGNSRQGKRDRDSRDSLTPPYNKRSRNGSPYHRRSGGGGGSTSRNDRSRNDSRRSKERRRRNRSHSRSRHRSPKKPSSSKKYRRRQASSGQSSSPDVSYRMSSSLIGEIQKQHGDIGSSRSHKKKRSKRRKHSSSSSSSSGEVLDGPASSGNGMNIPKPIPPPASIFGQGYQQTFQPPIPPLFPNPPPYAPPQAPPAMLMMIPPPQPPFKVPPPTTTVDLSMINIPPPPIQKKEIKVDANGLPLPSIDSRRIASRPVITVRRGNLRPNWSDSDSWYKTTLSDYNMIGKIGEGTYGEVYKAVNKKTGQQVALKRVRLENEREGFPITAVREIKILRQLHHQNVVRLYDIVLDDISVEELKKTRANFYLVFEYVDHDLAGLLESKELIEFSKEQICSIFKQLLEGLAYCHHMGFLHRDIKCSNILVNNRGELKIADLGLARLWQRETKRLYTNHVITLWYRPPELLLGDECYGPAVDVWSTGCMLGELFTRKPIFNGKNEIGQLELIAKVCGSPSTDTWPTLMELPAYRTMKLKKHYNRRIREEFEHIMPRDAVDLMDKMLVMNPDRRITAKDALLHPWIRNLDHVNVQPLQLPTHQDCHEMWSKKQKRSTRLGNKQNEAAGSSGSGHSNNRTTSLSRVC